MTEVVVVGAGPAGCAAAIQSVRLGLSVRLVDRTGFAGGLVREARLVENDPALEGPIRGAEYSRRLAAALDRFGIPVEQMSVTGVLKDGDTFTLATDDAPLAGRTAVLATGTEPAPLEIPGGDGFVMRSFLDLPHDLRGKRLVVIGGGEAALDYSLHAVDLGAMVEIMVRGSSTRARGTLLDAVTEHESVNILYDTRPVGIRCRDGSVILETVSAGRSCSLESDLILAAVGRTTVLPDLPGDIRSDLTASPAPGLFLCGDALLGSLGQAGTACGQGLQAAFGCLEYLDGLEGDR